jgi:hypothetical protein
MDLQQVQAAIDQLGQAKAADDFVHEADAAMGKAPSAVRDLVLDVGGSEHGSVGSADFAFVEAPFNAALAVGKLLS